MSERDPGTAAQEDMAAQEETVAHAVPAETLVRLGTDDQGVAWDVDVAFLGSGWTCIWGDGCAGIEARPDPDAALGCCSVGAEFLDDDEIGLVSSLAATLDPDRFQFAAAAADGILAPAVDGRPRNTRVVQGACIFLNRPGFAGGAGCALHLAALDEGDEPLEWKPSVCWQVPLRVERSGDRATLRRWRRSDWSADPDDVAWLCTEATEAYRSGRPVAERLAPELDALLGEKLADELRRTVGGGER